MELGFPDRQRALRRVVVSYGQSYQLPASQPGGGQQHDRQVHVRWSRFFRPVAKVYSRTSGRHWNDDETATAVHGELQEAGGA